MEKERKYAGEATGFTRVEYIAENGCAKNMDIREMPHGNGILEVLKCSYRDGYKTREATVGECEQFIAWMKRVKNLIKLKYTATSDTPNGDSTWNYIVTPERDCTIKEFVEAVLGRRQGEWGSFTIKGGDFEYKNGKMKDQIPEEILGKRMKKAEANGGWSLMSYYLEI